MIDDTLKPANEPEHVGGEEALLGEKGRRLRCEFTVCVEESHTCKGPVDSMNKVYC